MRAPRREHLDHVAGQPAPGCRGFRHPLLALQQAAGNRAVAGLVGHGPVLQRKMIVDGSPGDVSALFGLLRPATGHTYARDPKTKALSITGSPRKPTSPTLADKVKTVTDHPTQHAELQLGRKELGVQFGAFPGITEGDPHIVQNLRIDHFLALEKGVPGDGVAKLAHEIDESFAAHDGKAKLHELPFSAAFEQVHEPALITERDVAAEMDKSRGVAPGGLRHNTFYYLVGKEPARFRQTIEARENDFITYRMSFGTGNISHASRTSRVHVGDKTIGGFPFSLKGSLPAISHTVAAEVAGQLKKDPRLSVTLTGHCGFLGAAKDVELGTWWALSIQDLIVKAAADQVGVSDMRFHSTGVSDPRARHVEISLDRPDKIP